MRSITRGSLKLLLPSVAGFGLLNTNKTSECREIGKNPNKSSSKNKNFDPSKSQMSSNFVIVGGSASKE
jgi:hypothetical protein